MGLWVWLAIAGGLALLSTAGASSVATWRPKKAGGRRKRFAPRVEPFGSGELAGRVTASAPMVTFDLGELPAGDVSYLVRVEFAGPLSRGAGVYRLNVEQRDGAATIVMGGILPDYPASPTASTLRAWRRELFKLSEYLVDPSRGTVGYAGFGHYGADRMSFSLAGVFPTAVDLGGSGEPKQGWGITGPIDVQIKWIGIEV